MTIKIENLRREIDELDGQLIQILAQRFSAVKALGAVKRQAGIAIFDEEREAQMKQRFLNLAVKAYIQPELVDQFMSVIIEYSRFLQEEQNHDSNQLLPNSRAV